jgi:hypothetical protein
LRKGFSFATTFSVVWFFSPFSLVGTQEQVSDLTSAAPRSAHLRCG